MNLPVHFTKALYWFEQAVEHGHDEAPYYLGNMYYRGEGTQTDKKKALSLFKKAAEKGYSEAQYTCGTMYYKGEGTPVDVNQAFLWMEKAAEQGHALAKGFLQRCKRNKK